MSDTMRDTKRQTIIGTVISNRMDKTVVVQVETLKQHPDYKKYVRNRKNFKAHDEKNECELGDEVRCMETRPISKDKRWRVIEVLRKHYTSTAVVDDPDLIMFRKKKADAHRERAAAIVAEKAKAAEEAEAAKAAEKAAEASVAEAQPAETPAVAAEAPAAEVKEDKAEEKTEPAAE
jgi:small subunit ribosomal protein S17